MNIEDIKKKLDDLAYWGDISPNEIEKDVEYLLSIIETATNFFEKVEEWKSFSKENVINAAKNHMKAIRGS